MINRHARTITSAASAAALVLLVACADRTPVGPTGTPNLNHTGDPPPYEMLGHWTLCKNGTPASFEVSVNGGAATTVTLAAGQCTDVATTPVSGGQAAVTVTETVNSATMVLDSIRIDSLVVNGSPGSRMLTGTNTYSKTINGDVGVKVTFYNRPVPPPATGRMTGGGNQIMVGGVRISRGFTIHCDITLSNNLEINWPANKWHITKPLTSAVCLDDPSVDPTPPPAPFDTFIGEGVGQLNGQPGSTVKFTFVDGGEPGSGADKAKIQVFAPGGALVLDIPLSVLDNGNLQAHYDQPHSN